MDLFARLFDKSVHTIKARGTPLCSINTSVGRKFAILKLLLMEILSFIKKRRFQKILISLSSSASTVPGW